MREPRTVGQILLDEILDDMRRLVDEKPDTLEAIAAWWRRKGELWFHYASITTDGYGSACSDYTKAAEKYMDLGLFDEASDCRMMAASSARLWNDRFVPRAKRLKRFI